MDDKWDRDRASVSDAWVRENGQSLVRGSPDGGVAELVAAMRGEIMNGRVPPPAQIKKLLFVVAIVGVVVVLCCIFNNNWIAEQIESSRIDGRINRDEAGTAAILTIGALFTYCQYGIKHITKQRINAQIVDKPQQSVWQAIYVQYVHHDFELAKKV